MLKSWKYKLDGCDMSYWNILPYDFKLSSLISLLAWVLQSNIRALSRGALQQILYRHDPSQCLFHYFYFNYFPLLFHERQRRGIFPITFTTCRPPGKCQWSLGIWPWPLLVCILTQEVSSSPKVFSSSLIPWTFHHKPCPPAIRNWVAHSNMNACTSVPGLYSRFYII